MELLIIITLLVIATETTYLVWQALRKDRRMALAPVFVDTSVLIDGRIIAIAESGFITRPLYIPRSVVGELQFLADNADTEKRTRARHGLDVINQLQSITGVVTHIFPDGVKADEGVDNRLLTLAKKHSGALCTIDYNLNKVAVVEGIEVLNVNELAKSLRMAYLPGERMLIELTQKGNDQHQAVGHLQDGTMVVVEHAHKFIGSTVEVEFIRSLQTAAGKMMFAKLTHSVARPTKPATTRTPKLVVARATKSAAVRTAKPTAETTRATQKDAASHTPRVPRAQKGTQRQGAQRRTTPAPVRKGPKSAEDSLVRLANGDK